MVAPEAPRVDLPSPCSGQRARPQGRQPAPVL